MAAARRHTWLVRALFRAGRACERLAAGIHSLTVGLLHRRDLDAMALDAWTSFGADAGFVDAGLLSWEQRTFDEFVRTGDRILLVGCGSGRDLLALLRRGHEVVGVEPSPIPAERARELVVSRGFQANVLQSRFEESAPGGPFDVVVFSWFSYGYIFGRDRRIGALRKAASLLAAGGRIVVSYIRTGEPVPRLPVRIAHFSARAARTDWRAESNDSFYAMPSRSPLYMHQHAFGTEEIKREIAEAGLAVCAEPNYPDAAVLVLQGLE